MRNTDILVDQIDRDIAAGHGRLSRRNHATVRRARPVASTALAAILGMIPLTGSLSGGRWRSPSWGACSLQPC